jgi:hypothetical protein
MAKTLQGAHSLFYALKHCPHYLGRSSSVLWLETLATLFQALIVCSMPESIGHTILFYTWKHWPHYLGRSSLFYAWKTMAILFRALIVCSMPGSIGHTV